jgi:hypothetical protein
MATGLPTELARLQVVSKKMRSFFVDWTFPETLVPLGMMRTPFRIRGLVTMASTGALSKSVVAGERS